MTRFQKGVHYTVKVCRTLRNQGLKGLLGIKYFSVAYNVSCYVSLLKKLLLVTHVWSCGAVVAQLDSKKQHEHDSE